MVRGGPRVRFHEGSTGLKRAPHAVNELSQLSAHLWLVVWGMDLTFCLLLWATGFYLPATNRRIGTPCWMSCFSGSQEDSEAISGIIRNDAVAQLHPGGAPGPAQARRLRRAALHLLHEQRAPVLRHRDGPWAAPIHQVAHRQAAGLTRRMCKSRFRRMDLTILVFPPSDGSSCLQSQVPMAKKLG